MARHVELSGWHIRGVRDGLPARGTDLSQMRGAAAMASEAGDDSAAQIRGLVAQIREELQRNERFLKATNHYYTHYQNRTYDKVYALLSLIEQHALVLDYPSI